MDTSETRPRGGAAGSAVRERSPDGHPGGNGRSPAAPQPPASPGPGSAGGSGRGGGPEIRRAIDRSLPTFLIAIGLAILIAVALFATTGNEPASSTSAASVAGAYRIYGSGSGTVVTVDLHATETVQTIVPAAEGQAAVPYHVWTFGGTAPGPVIRVTEGDTVRFTLHNDSSIGMSHSIDFHAAQTPWDKNYQPVAPGESAAFDWVARFPGAFMYHCGVPPVLQHISNGMYGAIIVEPKTPLPKAREYVLVSSEFYPADAPTHGVYEGDFDKMKAGTPSYVVFNGVFNQYQAVPLVARPNELIRIWLVDAGPTLTTAFHVIGALFDHVYVDGNPTNTGLNGIQTWNVAPGGGAMFEMRIPDAGLYPFVTHSFAYTGKGAVGVIKIAPNAAAAPASYPTMGDPFAAGVLAAKAQPTGGTPVPSPTSGGSSGGANVTEGDPNAPNAYSLAMHNVAFAVTDFDVKADMKNRVTLTLVNMDALEHNFTVDELGITLTVGPNETKTFEFTAAAGIYDFFCSIPGHADAGMKGTMTVLPGMAH